MGNGSFRSLMTARKLRRVINEVRGKAVIEAQDMLRFMPYFAARVVEKNLKGYLVEMKILLIGCSKYSV